MSDVLTRLAANREERVRDLHLDLPIPTWDGTMIGRFDVMEREPLEKFSTRNRTLEADCDFVLACTREIYIYDPEGQAEGKRMDEDQNYVRIEDENGFPVKFDENLGIKLEVSEELRRARSVLLFCVKNNGVAIGAMVTKLVRWMSNTDSKVADLLVGE